MTISNIDRPETKFQVFGFEALTYWIGTWPRDKPKGQIPQIPKSQTQKGKEL